MDEALAHANGETPAVGDYMTRDVATVSADDTVSDVAARISESDHNGFPVTDGRHVEGFVSARDLLLADPDELLFKVMTEDLVVAHPEMDVTDAARVILRSGIQKLPVVDDAGNLVGIITNADVIRSQIERATPEKVGKLMRTLETIHGVSITEERRTVTISDVVPTQGKVYADELEGRRYELENGLAEPLVVIDNGSTGDDGSLLLADGHHRVMAAERAGVAEMDAYVIVLERAVDLGMARTARTEGLDSIADIDVVDYARHPLVETIERLQ
ncbi:MULTISPECIES: ParB/RepB/Spo0J family partition protein [Halobacterium]|uniref:CBS/parB domain protein n=4 Tax=Halobacterium salinarum TaxID=2242 RepID=Q9HRK9_HALSA|nr:MULTISPECIES: ParB/RepB/Spo0J family partition protein [Halobacterium]AAG19149.1 inosine-5'-monophosphate dehydrogenase [Halobacterium salinarum NRC-1]MBB6089991.1 IMP dehydrogenase [Halobacterium salinarum]MCF2165714.1 CBS domain-containing protein [Halobacterium salinarum]MCF2166584.1 CBS domain-containing protein [Halobacterium salinarum]MCF2207911.1 CBS domain-containing protein [Halobacterium salinarum]